jgi:hypothetical protein
VVLDATPRGLATLGAGTPQDMSDAEQNAETKPGPSNPRSEGADAPSPPGSPMRQDDTSLDEPPGGHDDAVSGSRTANQSASETGGGTIAIEDEQPDPATEPGEGHELQEENAETSEDQPSQ